MSTIDTNKLGGINLKIRGGEQSIGAITKNRVTLRDPKTRKPRGVRI
ncbi:hypothetical protein [Marinobacter sp. ELB17]|nr:hypothetical protein [Marinobacter sp. ELB17]